MTKRQRYMKKYNAEYRVTHRNTITAQQAVYYASHRKEKALYHAQRNIKNRKVIAKQQAEYRTTHREQIRKKQAEYRTTHRAEQAWYAMHRRAENKSGRIPTYANVHVCKRWSGTKGKENFVKDMGQPPKGTTLSRFADTGDYKPSNCAWHTWQQQGIERQKKYGTLGYNNFKE